LFQSEIGQQYGRKSNRGSLNPSRSDDQLELPGASVIASYKITQYSGPNLALKLLATKIVKIVILLKNPSWLFSFLRSLADEEEFVAGVDFPLHHLSWFDINGRC